MSTVQHVPLSGESRIRRASAAAVLTLGIMALLALPEGGVTIFACPLRDLTGLSCLTCGLTRSLISMSHGEVVGSLRYHLMGPLVLLGIVLLALRWWTEASTGWALRFSMDARSKRIAGIVFGSVWVLYACIRSLTEFWS